MSEAKESIFQGLENVIEKNKVEQNGFLGMIAGTNDRDLSKNKLAVKNGKLFFGFTILPS